MANPYSSQSSSGYNSNAPADDGSAVASNQVKFSTVKTVLADPVKTLADNINTAVNTAFGKVMGGAGVSTTSISYAVQTTDQGKFIVVTGAGGITITTPDATTVLTPFAFVICNTSSSSITIDGYSSQTVDGSTTITLPPGRGLMLNTDSSNWYTTGQGGIPAGNQMSYGQIVNGTITESNATTAVTFAIKTLAGNDPSASDPVLFAFRSRSGRRVRC